MTNGKKLRVGSKFVYGGEVFRVFKIEKKKFEGKTERLICYRPYYTNSINRSLTCSIPEGSLKEVNARFPVSKKEMDELLKSLGEISEYADTPAKIEAKYVLSLNDIHKTVEIIKAFWKEKKQKGEEFSQTSKDILDLAMDKVIEEVALVIGLTLDEAKKRVTKAFHN